MWRIYVLGLYTVKRQAGLRRDDRHRRTDTHNATRKKTRPGRDELYCTQLPADKFETKADLGLRNY